MKILHHFSPNLLSKLIFLGALSISLLPNSAKAGGFEEIRTGKTNTSIFATPNWESWGNSYWLNGNVCREKGANFICLTPQQAINNRWSIPLDNQNASNVKAIAS